MRAWSGAAAHVDIMGPSVTRTVSAKVTTPTLKNGGELRGAGYLVAVGSRSSRFRRKHQSKVFVLILLIIILLLLSLAIAMTVLYVQQKKLRPVKICESKECLRSAANLAVSMDTTVDPCHDFYKYVCGNWAEEHPRPNAYSSYDWFHLKHSRIQKFLRDFLTKNHTGQPAPVSQAMDMYTACMDIETLDKLGLQPILETLQMVGLPKYPTYLNVTDGFDYSLYEFDWLEIVIKVKIYLGMDILIGFDIFSDPKNSTVYRLAMGSPGTTNPFPSMHNERKRHAGKRTRAFRLPEDPLDDLIGSYFESDDESEDDDEEKRTTRLYGLYYAELIKAVFVASGGEKFTQLPEPEVDNIILKTADGYVTLVNTFYELESDENDTMSDDDYDFDVPEYAVDELQKETDRIVIINNGTTMPIWKKYLIGIFNVSDININYDEEKILVSEPDLKYMALLAAFLSKASTVSIELYIWMQVVEVMMAHTTTEMRALHERYYSLLHRGETDEGSSPPRSLQCAGAVNSMMGMAVSFAIADDKFLHTTKPKVELMLRNMKSALTNIVKKTSWMDQATKKATFEKVKKMRSLIGFPEWLLEEGKLEDYYKGVVVDPGTHLENMINIVQVRLKKGLNKYHEPYNLTWATDPTDVNAFHTFQENTISEFLRLFVCTFKHCGVHTQEKVLLNLWYVLDAAVPLVMLQYPFYDLGLESLNYGALGSVLGHEITHGFDNIGRQFDQDGNMVPWWSNETIHSFVNRTQCFIKQYSSIYLPEVDEYVNGKHTLSENIADNGGVREALGAYHIYLEQHGPELKLPGFEHMTPEQLFFLSYGNLWCSAFTRESLKSDLEDVHSPNHVRPRGALQNSVEFAQAFHCPVNSTMNPSTRCVIF